MALWMIYTKMCSVHVSWIRPTEQRIVFLVPRFLLNSFYGLLRHRRCVYLFGLDWVERFGPRWDEHHSKPEALSQKARMRNKVWVWEHTAALSTTQIFPESRRENDGIKMRSTCWKERERHCLFSNTRETKAVSDIDGSMETKKAFFKVFQTIMSL